MRRGWHKYGAKKVTLDGHKFDSQAEAKHYWFNLKPKLDAGIIRNLEIHPRINIEINGKKICTYIADFRYIDPSLIGPEGQQGATVVQDVKGFKTDVYKLKKKLVEACHKGTVIHEISGAEYRSMTLSDVLPTKPE